MKKDNKVNVSVAEAKAQERLNMMVEVFGLEPSQYETAKIAIDYAVGEVADPENHEDAVIATALIFCLIMNMPKLNIILSTKRNTIY